MRIGVFSTLVIAAADGVCVDGFNDGRSPVAGPSALALEHP